MQATICENCGKVQPKDDPTGWVLVHKLGLVEPGVNPFEALFGPPMHQMPEGKVPGHTDHFELCGSECLIAFTQNGYKSTFEGLNESEVPPIAADATPETEA
jgi:hypothetical protein